ncbi:MAG: STAS domain-containing protein [Methylotenera sp.]|nr:STAS domain-containing protein [Methylotenera sp.]
MSITANENQWLVAGDILMDNANTILSSSNALAMPQNLQINLDSVTEVDTAAISLMLEWRRRAVAQNTRISFTHVPEALASLAVLYGVAEFIPLSA